MSSQQIAHEKKLKLARIVLRNPSFLKMSAEEKSKVIETMKGGGLSQAEIDTLVRETRLLGRE